MFNNKRVGVIEEYKDRLGLTGDFKSPVPNGYWQRLSDYYSKMSADQQNFVNSNDKVLSCKTKMMEAFNLFIFENYKDEFVKLDGFRELCDEYVNAVIAAGQEYSEHVANTAKENESLKAKITELERKLNEQHSNTN